MNINITKKITSVFIFVIFAISAPAFAKSGPDGFSNLAKKLSPAVVNISTVQKAKKIKPTMGGGTLQDRMQEELEKRFGFGNRKKRGLSRERRSLGSGFIIASSGVIITNNHVIEGADEITVKLHDDTEYKAKIIGRDTKVDIAVLQLIMKKKKSFPFVKFGNANKMNVGDWVLAFGNPYGLGLSVTAGIISASHRAIGGNPFDNYLQTDASINRGNSGGPMFNMEGEVVGINTAIFSPTGGNVGIGFAIPSNQAVKIIKQIQKFGHAKRGLIGVMIGPVDDEIAESLGMSETYGAMVQDVVKGGPAEKGGVMQGDVIIKFNNKRVDDNKELSRIVADTVIGKIVPVIVLREGKEKTLSLTVGEMPNDTRKKKSNSVDSNVTDEIFGMSLEDITDNIRGLLKFDNAVVGALVSAVELDSAAFKKGIRRGDVITQVSYKDVKTVTEAMDNIAMVKKQGRSSVLLKIYRASENGGKGMSFYRGIKFPEKAGK